LQIKLKKFLEKASVPAPSLTFKSTINLNVVIKEKILLTSTAVFIYIVKNK
jgi:hypothetical protein